jgi:hypothetical protein
MTHRLQIVRHMKGHDRLVKQLADILLVFGSVLTLTGSLLNLRAVSDGPDRRGDGLTWRARFMVENRRHPRLRGAAIACLLAAWIAYIGYVVALFG